MNASSFTGSFPGTGSAAADDTDVFVCGGEDTRKARVAGGPLVPLSVTDAGSRVVTRQDAADGPEQALPCRDVADAACGVAYYPVFEDV